MNIRQIINHYKENNVYNEFSLVEKTLSWELHYSIRINGIIAAGWLKNNDVLIIGADAIFISSNIVKKIIDEDYDTDFNKHMSSNNLFYDLSGRNELVNVFGIRGGGGNLFSTKYKLALDSIYFDNTICIPRVTNLKDNSFDFIELPLVHYSEKLLCGFSDDESLFMVKGSNFINVYKVLT